MSDKKTILEKCKNAAKQMRKDALYMTYKAGNPGAHIGGGLSMIEIMATLYVGIMKLDINDMKNENRDRFILSKGHGVLGLYTAMNQAGLIDREEYDGFKKNDTFLTGHPSMNLERGIEFSSGSLGQGLSLGVGTCIALREKGNTSSRAFVLLGDGECNEGSVWEAAMSAAHFKLNNLVAIVDKNGIQYDGGTDKIMDMGNLKDKWESFGWEVVELDGHNIEELYEAFNLITEKPKVIIAHTVKGKGVSFMENNSLWHNSRLTDKQYEEAMAEQEA